MLAANVAEQLPQLGRERFRPTLVLARAGEQPQQPALLEGVEPALERGDRVATACLRPRRDEALLAQLLQGGLQLAPVHLRLGECADDAVAKHRHRLLVCLWFQLVHVCPLVTFGMKAHEHRAGLGQR